MPRGAVQEEGAVRGWECTAHGLQLHRTLREAEMEYAPQVWGGPGVLELGEEETRRGVEREEGGGRCRCWCGGERAAAGATAAAAVGEGE